MAGESIRFLETDVFSQVWVCRRCFGKERQDLLCTVKMQPKCSSENSIQRENDWMEPEVAGGQGKDRVKAENTSGLPQGAGAHERVPMDPVLCISVVIL